MQLCKPKPKLCCHVLFTEINLSPGNPSKQPILVQTSSHLHTHLISSTWLLLTLLIPLEAVRVYFGFHKTHMTVFCRNVHNQLTGQLNIAALACQQ